MEKKKSEINQIGSKIYDLIKELFPICRSITGIGVRKSLGIIKKKIPIEIIEVPSGTIIYDWTIPKEWNIKNAYIKNRTGEKIVDFTDSNLHILNYSIPKHSKIQYSELKDHIYTLPQYPDWIPYRTSYYNENWGFCMTEKSFQKLEKGGEFEVFIDSSLENGSLTYGEFYISGENDEEFLLSTYICHPSMCNDNLTGPAILTFLADKIIEKKRLEGLKYSYRFLWIPETIGAITWLSKNEEILNKIKDGLVLTCLGDSGPSTYKKSRRGDAMIDKIAEKVLIDSNQPYKIIDFYPYGSDERQYCSPGFNLSIGSLMRTPYGNYPEYHTSADNLEFIKSEYLADSYDKYWKIISIVEQNKRYINLNPKGEPQLGKRGLYDPIGGKKLGKVIKEAILWVLNLSDGTNTLLDIAIHSKISFGEIKKASNILEKKGLLRPIDDD